MPTAPVNTTRLDDYDFSLCLVQHPPYHPDSIQYDDMAPLHTRARKQDGEELACTLCYIDMMEYYPNDHPFAPHITRFSKRDGRTDTTVPGPPPLYSPSIPLHASITPYEEATSTLGTAPQETGIATPPTRYSHGTNVGLLVGAVLAASAVVLLLIGLGRYLVRQNAKAILRSHPRFSMWLPGADRPEVADEPEVMAKKCPSELRQFVYVSNSDGDLNELS
jgi:hypothetical protein